DRPPRARRRPGARRGVRPLLLLRDLASGGGPPLRRVDRDPPPERFLNPDRRPVAMLSRRDWLAMVVGGAALGALGAPASALARGAVEVKVYKSPTCGCCGKWVDHLRAAGFAVEVEDVADMEAVKADHGV